MDSNSTITYPQSVQHFTPQEGGVLVSNQMVEELLTRIGNQSSSVRYAHSQGAFNGVSIEEVHQVIGNTLSLEGIAGLLKDTYSNAKGNHI